MPGSWTRYFRPDIAELETVFCRLGEEGTRMEVAGASDIAEAIALLRSVSEKVYWESHLPVPLDSRIGCICSHYRQSTADSRSSFVASLDRVCCYALGTFAVRAAMLGARRHDERRLAQALVAEIVVLERGLLDTRDVLVDLSVVYYSAAKLGKQAALFEEAATYALTEDAARVILGCLNWSPNRRVLDLMGWRETRGPAGVVYAYQGQPIPVGHLQP